MEKLTSTSNLKIKRLVHLAKARERKEQNIIVIEGFREIKMAFDSGFNFKELYICNEIFADKELHQFVSALNCTKYEITKELFEKVAYRENSDGLIVLAEPKYLKFADLKLPKNPLILVLESVEKPGNLGAMLRTSDAAHVDAVFVCDPQTEIYNPNVIRSSIGCIFTQQIIVCDTQMALDFFRSRHIKTYAACLTATNYYHETDLSNSAAIVMGTEADGLTETWLKGADFQIKIPMMGKVDSLNVSTSAAVLIYEAQRQRNFDVINL
jgi:TrmH family RNA methyltransferase